MSTTELIEFCRKKQSECEALVRARRSMAASWEIGSDEQWRAAAKMRGSKFVPRTERHRLALIDTKIATKHASDAEMYAAIVERLAAK